jgi:hypothetical protein
MGQPTAKSEAKAKTPASKENAGGRYKVKSLECA